MKRPHPDGPDPSIDGDLMDPERLGEAPVGPAKLGKSDAWADSAAPEPAEETLGEAPTRRIPVLLRAAMAALTATALLAWAVGPTLDIFTLPSLDFLRASRELADHPVIQRVRPAVVQLYVDGQGIGGSSRQGTGFNIAPDGLIVTNRHIVEGARLVAASFRDHGTYFASEWTVHPHADLALVRLRRAESLPSVPLGGPSLVPPGEKVLLIGNPLGFTSTASEGRVRGYRQLTDNGRRGTVLEIEAPIHPGSSGSPVLDEYGHVVAVVFARLETSRGSPERGLAVPIGELALLLDAFQSTNAPPATGPPTTTLQSTTLQ